MIPLAEPLKLEEDPEDFGALLEAAAWEEEAGAGEAASDCGAAAC